MTAVLCARSNVNCSTGIASTATVFQLSNQGTNTIALKAATNNLYVTVDLTQSAQLIANKTTVSTAEKYIVAPQ